MAIEPVRIPAPAPADAAVRRRGSMPADVFAANFDRELPNLYAFVARRIADRTAAEQLVSRVFERAVEAAQEAAIDEWSIRPFLYRVAANAVVDHARRGRRITPRGMRASDFDEGSDGVDAEAISDEAAARGFAAALDRAALRKAVVDLDDGARHVVLLAFFDGLDRDALAAAMGTSPDAAAEELKGALHALRTVMTVASDAG